MYPIISRQIKSNHRMRFDRPDGADIDADTQVHLDSRTAAAVAAPDRSLSLLSIDLDDQLPQMKQLGAIKRWHKAHFFIFMVLYLFEVLRYVLAQLISIEILNEYHYLDCFMFGRFRYFGRTNKIAGSLEMTFLMSFIVYRYIVFVKKPELKFQVLEFLLLEYKHVAEIDREFKWSERVRKQSALASCPSDSSSDWPPPSPTTTATTTSTTTATKQVNEWNLLTKCGLIKPNLTFYLKNNFCDDSDDNCANWILRPNRTSKSWTILSRCARFGLFLTLASTISYLVLVFYLLLGAMTTDLGFEMAYPTCVAYIQDKQQRAVALGTINCTDELPYSQIYLAPRKLAHQTSIDDIPFRIVANLTELQSMSAYKWLRVSSDVIVNFFAYLEFLLLLIPGYFMVFIFSIDIMINARAIRRRLNKLTSKLKLLHETCSDQLWHTDQDGAFNYSPGDLTIDQPIDRPNGPAHRLSNCTAKAKNEAYMAAPTSWNQASWCLKRLDTDSKILQAILADHFQLVHDYNKLIAFYYTFTMAVLFGFSMVFCPWTIATKSRTIEHEFLRPAEEGSFFMPRQMSECCQALGK